MKNNKSTTGGHDSLGDFSLNIVLWLFLPSFITSTLQKIYYLIRYRTDSVFKPTPGSPKFQKHYNRIYILVVGSYLLFCIFQVIYSLPLNYYSEFGVATGAGDKDLKAKFRKYSLQYHPDRNPTEEASNQFMRIRKIYETLSDPISREAYNKFGLLKQCMNCLIFKDYLWQGLMEFIGFYGGTGLVLIVLNMVGAKQFGSYWRFMAYFLMAALEASWIILPYDPFAWFLPNLTVAEKISVLHQSVIYIFIALSQFGPILFSNEDRDLKQSVTKLEAIVSLLAKETQKSLKMAFDPFINNFDMLDLLKKQMQMHSVQMRLFEHDKDFRAIRKTVLSGSIPSTPIKATQK